MDEKVRKYLSHISGAINEIEAQFADRPRRFDMFMSDIVFRRFVERNIEIMGEAMNRILKINPDIEITSARKIVDTRNFVIHGYDSLLPEIIWAIVINHLPKLGDEVRVLLEK